jgi:prepilin-type N-terminal cleavage/methylation domain-containing protein/prepilin-type processing-associated H-X9-DG protein
MAGRKNIQISNRPVRHHPGPKTNPFGFTLVELLVVIAIISLLLSILTPSLMKARSVAMRVKCVHNLKQIDLAMHLYVGANDDMYPCALDPVYTDPDTGKKIWLWMGRGWRPFVEPYIGGNVDVNNPSVLLCPSDRTNPATFGSTSYAYSMAFYYSPEQIKDMNDPSYTCGNGGPFVLPVPQRILDVTRPSGKILIGEWNSNHLRVVEKGWYGFGGWWCLEGSRNFLFVDGHVCYLAAEDIRPAQDGWPNPNLTIHGIKGIDYSP